MEVLILVLSFVILLTIGVPIAFSIGIAGILTMLMSIDALPAFTTYAHRMATGLDSFALLAIPFFVLAGGIMNSGGIAMRLINFARVLVGRLPAGLAFVNVIANMLFGAISGSAAAATSAIGSIMGPEMKKEGYDENFSAAVNITSATTGLTIPPSNILIIYSLASGGASITALFLAGYVPGILTGVGIMLVAMSMMVRKNKGTRGLATLLGKVLVASVILLGAGIGLKALHGQASPSQFQGIALWIAGPLPGLLGLQVSHPMDLFQVCLSQIPGCISLPADAGDCHWRHCGRIFHGHGSLCGGSALRTDPGSHLQGNHTQGPSCHYPTVCENYLHRVAAGGHKHWHVVDHVIREHPPGCKCRFAEPERQSRGDPAGDQLHPAFCGGIHGHDPGGIDFYPHISAHCFFSTGHGSHPFWHRDGPEPLCGTLHSSCGFCAFSSAAVWHS
jgi:hypothetical protein